MNAFDKARNKIKELEALINPTMQKVFDKYDYVIHDYQTDEQLFKKGERSDGSIIRNIRTGEGYTPYTIKLKKQKGQPTNRVTWKDTGRLHKEIKVIANDEFVVIKTSVPYADKLFKKYGDDVLGIQKEFLEKFLDLYILPTLKEEFDDTIAKS